MHIGQDCSFVILLTNLPDRDSALSLATDLLELRLAACVNVLQSCVSMYHWQGKIETADEVPVWIKAPVENYAAIEQVIRTRHPYELPEIIALPVLVGHPGYLEWIATVCRSADGRQAMDNT
jgi:periplasmic divalent cation tolerance protein